MRQNIVMFASGLVETMIGGAVFGIGLFKWVFMGAVFGAATTLAGLGLVIMGGSQVWLSGVDVWEVIEGGR